MNEGSIPLALVAFEKEQFIGTASLIKCDMDDRTELFPWLAAVLVKPENRNRGVGTLLLKSIDIECLKFGYNRYYLYTA